jgi:hypothetical protein
LRGDTDTGRVGIYDGVLIPLALNGIDGIIHGIAVHDCGEANTIDKWRLYAS